MASTIASWVKGRPDQVPPKKNEALVVCETLLMELDFQMKCIEQSEEDKKQEERRKSGAIDYSWLMNTQKKSYEMPQLDRLELEELCYKVKPEETGRVITEFRNALASEPTVQECPRLLRACILQLLEGRPREDTMMEWMMKSVTKLRPSSSRSKIAPIQLEEETGSSIQQLKNLSKDDEILFEKRKELPLSVDDLPV